MLLLILQSTFITLSILLILFVFIASNRTLEKNKTNRFLVAIFMSFLLIIVDAIDYWCAHSNLSLLLYYLTTAFGYTFRPFSICLIIAMIDSKIAKTHYLTTVPLLINGFLCFTSYFHRLVYFYNTDRIIQRGPLWFIPFIASIFSLVFLCTITFRKYQLSRKRESAFIITLYSLVSIALICESVHQLWFLLDGIGALALVFYYLFLHTQTYKRDSLTNVLNRHCFYCDMDHYKKIACTLVSIDLNNLKVLNDKKGHAAGDQALISISEIIISFLPSPCTLYRMGGDEFLIICPKYAKQEIEEIMQKILSNLEKTSYRIAYGISTYQIGDDFEKSMIKSDKLMYKNKEATKRCLCNNSI